MAHPAYDNPAAFPLACPAGFEHAEPGMTLRDWFAGQAIAGMYANGYHNFVSGEYRAAGFVNDAYDLADEMLAARVRA